ncbi:hypothetical protein QJ48_00715 [Paenibacillus sp. A3]|nr:hypothetical protein QJ48_00715 [Paenibacillus sp. A3]
MRFPQNGFLFAASCLFARFSARLFLKLVGVSFCSQRIVSLSGNGLLSDDRRLPLMLGLRSALPF